MTALIHAKSWCIQKNFKYENHKTIDGNIIRTVCITNIDANGFIIQAYQTNQSYYVLADHADKYSLYKTTGYCYKCGKFGDGIKSSSYILCVPIGDVRHNNTCLTFSNYHCITDYEDTPIEYIINVVIWDDAYHEYNKLLCKQQVESNNVSDEEMSENDFSNDSISEKDTLLQQLTYACNQVITANIVTIDKLSSNTLSSYKRNEEIDCEMLSDTDLEIL